MSAVLDLLAAIGWPVLDRIHVGPLAISPHGIGIALGYLLGSWWMLREGPKRGLSEDDIGSVLLRALVGAIVGARLFYVIAHWGEPGLETFADVIAIWKGGISLLGGIFGAMIASYPFMRKQRMGFLRTMDSAAIGLAFGIFVGRIGDLVIGDHLGKPTSKAWAWVYQGGNLSGYDCETVVDSCFIALQGGITQEIQKGGPVYLRDAQGVDIAAGVGVHQTALYDFVSSGLLFGFLWWLNRKPRRNGVLIATFAVWYGLVRFGTDFLRIDKEFFGFTGSQWTGLVTAIVALFALIKWRLAGDHPEAEEDEELEPALVGGSADDDDAEKGAWVDDDRPAHAFDPPGMPPSVEDAGETATDLRTDDGTGKRRGETADGGTERRAEGSAEDGAGKAADTPRGGGTETAN